MTVFVMMGVLSGMSVVYIVVEEERRREGPPLIMDVLGQFFGGVGSRGIDSGDEDRKEGGDGDERRLPHRIDVVIDKMFGKFPTPQEPMIVGMAMATTTTTMAAMAMVGSNNWSRREQELKDDARPDAHQGASEGGGRRAI